MLKKNNVKSRKEAGNLRFTSNSCVELKSNLDVEVSAENRQNLRKSTAAALEASGLFFTGRVFIKRPLEAGRRAGRRVGDCDAGW